MGFPDDLATNRATESAWGDFTLHLAWVQSDRRLLHSVKTEYGSWSSTPVLNVQVGGTGSELTSPAIVFYNNRAHIAVQKPGIGLFYFRSNLDYTWSPGALGMDHAMFTPVDVSGPRMEELFGQLFIFGRTDTGTVRFYRVEQNQPIPQILHSGDLRGTGVSLSSGTNITATRSMGELYVGARGQTHPAGSYINATRAIARSTFIVTELAFNQQPECRTFDQPLLSFHQRRTSIPYPQNATDECGFQESSVFPGSLVPVLSFPPPLTGSVLDHVAYTRTAAIFWSVNWSVWEEVKDRRDYMYASLRGMEQIGRGGGNNFWLGYDDMGGTLDANLAPPVSPSSLRDGFLDQELTHPLWPMPLPGADLFEDVLEDPKPSSINFPSGYGETSVDHNFIELWYRYRFEDAAAAMRQRVADGLAQGQTRLLRETSIRIASPRSEVPVGGRRVPGGRRPSGAR